MSRNEGSKPVEQESAGTHFEGGGAAWIMPLGGHAACCGGGSRPEFSGRVDPVVERDVRGKDGFLHLPGSHGG